MKNECVNYNFLKENNCIETFLVYQKINQTNQVCEVGVKVVKRYFILCGLQYTHTQKSMLTLFIGNILIYAMLKENFQR